MPLVVKRIPVSSGAQRLVLTDADAMGGMGGLSGQSRVEVSARVSFQGVADPAAGDWVAEPVTLDLTDSSAISVELQVKQP
jgi:hypothetical protein